MNKHELFLALFAVLMAISFIFAIFINDSASIFDAHIKPMAIFLSLIFGLITMFLIFTSYPKSK